MSRIIGYRMLTPGTTRGAVSDEFYSWASGHVYYCPEVPVGEFAHMDPANCLTLTAGEAPEVHTASIDPSDIETRPVKKARAKKG
jgi:hypothetical protein